ncbi:hypothetical protein DFH07DRAFT_707119, partial [Mycena maculata]
TKGNTHIILVGQNRVSATTILEHLEKLMNPGIAREFMQCDLSLIQNTKHTSTVICTQFPHVNLLVMSVGAILLMGLDVTDEGVNCQVASLYYSKWAFIDGLLPVPHAVLEAGEDVRVAAIHTAGRGRPINFNGIGLEK